MSCPALPSRSLAAFIVGPLGLGSPRFRAGVAPCPAVLCVATTAFVRPGRCALCSLPVPWVDALFVSLPACAGVGSSTGRADCGNPGNQIARLLLSLFVRFISSELYSSALQSFCVSFVDTWTDAER